MNSDTACDFGVPAEFVDLAREVDEIGETLRWYLSQEPLWLDRSPAVQSLDHEQSYAALPFERPIVSTLIQPVLQLGHALDHLVAAASLIRTPRTVYALLTVLRPLLVSAASAYYLSDDTIDLREHVRRAMNFQLESDTELMNYIQEEGDAFDHVDARRRAIAKAAKELSFRVAKPESKKGSHRWGQWYLDTRPPTEMTLLNGLLGHVRNREIGSDFYRLLSSVTHAQQHAVYTVIQVSTAVPLDDGLQRVALGISGPMLVTWTVSTCAALDTVMRRCCNYYGWNPLRWNSVAPPKILKWRAWLSSD